MPISTITLDYRVIGKVEAAMPSLCYSVLCWQFPRADPGCATQEAAPLTIQQRIRHAQALIAQRSRALLVLSEQRLQVTQEVLHHTAQRLGGPVWLAAYAPARPLSTPFEN
jgi:hypothetical protein